MTVQFDANAPPTTPRDAATVILLRDGAHGLEVFFVKRHADVRFMGGAYVFPGGKVDEDDRDPGVPGDLDAAAAAARLHDDDRERARALHVAAARECLEEAGVFFTTNDALGTADVAALRHACDVEKKPLVEILPPRGATLRLSALVPFARWITPRLETRRFDARFFLAVAPHGVHATHDNGETVASLWLAPGEALARAERQEIVLVPPTYRTVQLLARANSVAAALALASPSALEPHEPRAAFTDDGAAVVLLRDDPAYAAGEFPVRPGRRIDPARELATRFTYRDGAWQAGRFLT
jgi:8-oxo-dGTP pyrophosphatase MutT (NUDIX family)